MRLFAAAALLVFSFALTGCQSNGGNPEQADTASGSASSTEPAGEFFAGTVVETMNAAGYTYVKVDTGTEQIWAAGPEQEMKVGTKVKIAKGMPMSEFHSETLERTFDTLYFVSEFGDHSHDGGQADPHAGMMGGDPHGGAANTGKMAREELSFDDIEPADHTVGVIYEKKAELAGQPVRVRGKVVKALTGIMGTNWLHVQDGSGTIGANDLTVTTSGTAPVGSTVLIEGKLSVDRDFGSGYRYDVIVEDAAVTVE